MLQLIPLTQDHLLKSRKEKFRVLSLLLNITKEAIEAIAAFLEHRYNEFDAQVGETLCQIRAYKICLLANSDNFRFVVKIMHKRLIEYQQQDLLVKYNELTILLKHVSAYNKLLDSKETLGQFITALQLNFTLDQDCTFVITAYFLKKYCLVDVDNFPNAINYALIKQNFTVGSTTAKNIANKYQHVLSKLSCDFVFMQYQLTNDTLSVLQALLRVGDRKRQALPYYEVTKILLYSPQLVDIPVILSVMQYGNASNRTHVLYFTRDPRTKKLNYQSTINPQIYTSSAIIFRCITYDKSDTSLADYVNTLLQQDIDELILLNAASHPQYTGESLHEHARIPFKNIEINDIAGLRILQKMIEEFSNMEQRAKKIGCSKNNPRLLYVQHILCGSLAYELEVNRSVIKGNVIYEH